MTSRLEQLREKQRKLQEEAREKQRQLQERIRLIEAAQNKRVRQHDNRLKLLEGVALRAWVAKGKMSQEEYRQLLDEGLTLDRDRKLFGLPLRGEGSAEAASGGQASPEVPAKAQEGSRKVEGGRAYLQAAYEDREQVKALGGRWDSSKRAWYVPEGVELEPFGRWLPAKPAEGPGASSPGVQDQAKDQEARGQEVEPAQGGSKRTPAAQPSKPAAPAAEGARKKGAEEVPKGERRKGERRQGGSGKGQEGGETERRKGERRKGRAGAQKAEG